MDQNQKIETYLSDPDKYYQLGVELYQELGNNTGYKRILLRQVKNAQTVKMLKYQLEKCIRPKNSVSNETLHAIAEPMKAIAANLHKMDFAKISKSALSNKVTKEDLPPELHEYWDLKEVLYRESNHLHAKLEILDENAREDAARNILGNFEIIDMIWEMVDHFIKTKEVKITFKISQEPQKGNEVINKFAKFDDMSEVELLKSLQNTRSQITRAKKKEDNESQVKELEARKTYIEAKLKAINAKSE
jgi:hypothetical protein